MKLAERYLPRQIWDRPKQGFILPMRDWLSQWFLQMGGGKYCLENAVQGLNNKAISVWVDAVTNDAMSIGWERSLFSLLLLFEWATKFSIKLTSLTQSYRRAGL
jgi:asparagine synthase (glutamine-hydrolysing)